MKTSAVVWRVTLALLYLLASPIYFLIWMRRMLETHGRLLATLEGRVVCPHCGFRNLLDILALCPRCGTTEFGSRLFCTTCKQVTRAFQCDRCTATIRVL